MATFDFALHELDDKHAVLPFCCGDDDLNEFLRDDAARLQAHHVARTYVVLVGDQLGGYATVLADTVELKGNEKKGLGLNHDDPKNVPAIKLARLGIASAWQGHRIGRYLVGLAATAGLAVSGSVGCRLLTVDAYRKSVGFYEKLGFVPNKAPNKLRQDSIPPGEEPRTISMRFDLRADPLPKWFADHAGL